jgi:hypothetical protein
MAYSIEVQNASLHIVEKLRTVQDQIVQNVAAFTQRELIGNNPPPPGRGSGRFVSDRQRRYVMMLVSQGQVPYVRGRGKTQRLNRSYLILPELLANYVLVSTAAYAPYVIGDKQADIHKGRWITAVEAGNKVAKSGEVQTMIQTALRSLFS